MKLKGVLCGTCVGAKQLSRHPEGLMDKRSDDTCTIQGFNAWNSPIPIITKFWLYTRTAMHSR